MRRRGGGVVGAIERTRLEIETTEAAMDKFVLVTKEIGSAEGLGGLRPVLRKWRNAGTTARRLVWRNVLRQNSSRITFDAEEARAERRRMSLRHQALLESWDTQMLILNSVVSRLTRNLAVQKRLLLRLGGDE